MNLWCKKGIGFLPKSQEMSNFKVLNKKLITPMPVHEEQAPMSACSSFAAVSEFLGAGCFPQTLALASLKRTRFTLDVGLWRSSSRKVRDCWDLANASLPTSLHKLQAPPLWLSNITYSLL